MNLRPPTLSTIPAAVGNSRQPLPAWSGLSSNRGGRLQRGSFLQIPRKWPPGIGHCLLLGAVLQLVLPFWINLGFARAATGEGLVLAEGFRADLFASDQTGAVSPPHARFDASGRLWVVTASAGNAHRPGAESASLVQILEDANRDGRADKRSVFTSESSTILALETTAQGCMILTDGALLELLDTNGDDRVDERRILWKDTGLDPIAGRIQWIRWGPGGELWMMGTPTNSRRHGAKTPPQTSEASVIWRFNRARSEILAFDPMALAYDQPQGFALEAWLGMQVLTGHGPKIHQSTPLIFPTNDFHQWSFSPPAGAGFGPVLGEFIHNDHFPDSWQGRLLVASAAEASVRSFETAETGSSFELIERPPLVKSNLQDFHPVDIQSGPDGAVYLLDAGPSQNPGERTKTTKIWRIHAENRRPSSRPRPAGLTTPELFEQLSSGDGFVWQHAARILESRPADEVLRGYAAWTQNLTGGKSTEVLQALSRAAAVLQSHACVPTELLERLMSSRDPRPRMVATRLIAEGALRPDQKSSLLSAAAKDPHPGVRLRAIAGLATTDSVESFLAALSACDLPLEGAIDLALRRLISVRKARWLPLLEAGRLGMETRTGQLEYLVRADGSPEAVRAVRKMLFKRHPTREQRQPLSLLLARIGEMEDFEQLIPHLLYISQGAHNVRHHAAVLEVIVDSSRERMLEPTVRLESGLNELLRDPPRIQAPALQLIAHWKLTNLVGEIAALAVRTNTTMEVRVAAVQALGRLGTEPAIRTIRSLSNPTNTWIPVRAAAAASLVRFEPRTASELAAGVLNADVSGASVPFLIPGFLARNEFALLLSDALRLKPSTRRAAGEALQLLNRSGRISPQLAETLGVQAGQRFERRTNSPALLRELEQMMRTSGNVLRGADLFRRPDLACTHCHRSRAYPSGIGPALESWQGRRSLGSLLDSMLVPHQEISPGYALVELVLKNGESIVGNLVKSLHDRVQIQEISTSRVLEISSSQISQSSQKGSAMPEGLVDSLTLSELGDLLKYLAEPVAPTLNLPSQALTKP